MLLAVMPQPLPLPFGGTERRFPMCKRLATFERLWNQRLSKRPLTCSAAFAPGEKAQGGFFGAPLRAMPRGAYYCPGARFKLPSTGVANKLGVPCPSEKSQILLYKKIARRKTPNNSVSSPQSPCKH